MPFEYSQELDENLLKRLTAQMEQRGASDIGTARSEAIGRGLGGDVYEASAGQAARRGLEDRIGDMTANFGYRSAGLRREERLGEQDRDFTREGWDRQDAQASRERDFSERMSQLGYERDQKDWRNSVWGSLISGGARAGGQYLAQRYGYTGTQNAGGTANRGGG